MIRVALIGVSGYGRCYLDAVRELTGDGLMRLVAACIVNRAEEGELWDELCAQGVRCFEESAAMWQEMRGRVDLTLVPTPPHTHCPLAIEAFSAGSHVLVEKPVATCVADARRMEAASMNASRRLFVGFQDLYIENNWNLKREFSRGDYGKLRSISFLGLWPRPISYYTRNTWAGRLKLGNQIINDTPVSNAFAHHLNLCLFFAGPDETTSAAGLEIEAELSRANEIETFDTAALRITTDTGIPIHFFCSHACGTNVAPIIRIVTESATIIWKFEEWILTRNGEHEEHRKLPAGLDTRTPMLGNIVKALRGETADICTTEIAVASLAVSERLRELRVEKVSPSRIRRIQMAEDTLVSVEGIDETLKTCSESGLLPGEFEGGAMRTMLAQTYSVS